MNEREEFEKWIDRFSAFGEDKLLPWLAWQARAKLAAECGEDPIAYADEDLQEIVPAQHNIAGMAPMDVPLYTMDQMRDYAEGYLKSRTEQMKVDAERWEMLMRSERLKVKSAWTGETLTNVRVLEIITSEIEQNKKGGKWHGGCDF